MKLFYKKYAQRKQTYNELQNDFHITPKTLRKYFDKHPQHTGEVFLYSSPLALTLDATFFSRSIGILVLRAMGTNVFWRHITTEKVEEYERCLVALETIGNTFSSFTIDGRRGVRQFLERRYPTVPIQHCQFHMKHFVQSRLTLNPKSSAGKNLLEISRFLIKSTRQSFTEALTEWEGLYGDFLRERTENLLGKRKWFYTHRNLRSAFFSIKRNLPRLFTFEEFPSLKIPNTTNSCEGYFGHLKRRIAVHQGISRKRQKQMINYILEVKYLS